MIAPTLPYKPNTVTHNVKSAAFHSQAQDEGIIAEPQLGHLVERQGVPLI